MAKTPLFAAVKRALKTAARMERRGLSTSDGLEQLEEQADQRARLNRREFLKVAGTAAAGAVLVPTLDGSLRTVNAATAPSVVIVGAGLAGLTAAYRLNQGGIKARVFEALPDRVGGRVRTVRGTFGGGLIGELGGEFIDTGHTAIRKLAKELGIAEADLSKSDGKLITQINYFNGQKLSQAALVEDFHPVAKAIIADLATLTGDDVTSAEPNGGEALDKMSIAQWFDAKGIKGTVRELLEVVYTTEYGLPPGEQSVFNLLYLIGTDEGESVKLLGESDENFHLVGGNDQLATRMASRLSRQVEFNNILESIQPKGTGYTLNFRRDSSINPVFADVVILTIPFSTLRAVDLSKLELPAPKLNAINTLGYGSNSKILAGMKERIWRTKYNSNGTTYSDLPYQSSWEAVRYQTGRAGILVNYRGGAESLEILGSDQRKTTEEFLSQLEPIYPGITAQFNIKLAIADWPKQPFIRGSYSAYKPGQWTTIRGIEGEAVGNLHFAGEHTSLNAQGYMEGAVESGERAAEEVLIAAGLKKAK